MIENDGLRGVTISALGELPDLLPKRKRKSALRETVRRAYAPGFFAGDINPLFRPIDISYMKSAGVKLDDYTYMSDPNNANKVLATLSPHNYAPPSMPPGGPYWTVQLALFAQRQKDGY
jgi:hypothetical protein